jgi:NADPH:quinone reductase-like Zn-dependent oxidoreductase
VDLANFADGFAQLAELVAPGGRAASLLGVADEEQLAARDITATNVVGMADPALLTHLAELVASRELRIPDQRVFSLEEATEGLDAFEKEHTRGKLAISVTAT